MLCSGQTTDPGSEVSGRSLLYTFVEDDREVVFIFLQSFGGSSVQSRFAETLTLSLTLNPNPKP